MEDQPMSPAVTEQPPDKKKRFWESGNSEKFRFFTIYPRIRDYFKLSLPYTMFLTRCADDSQKNSVYFTTEKVRQVMENNVDHVKVINTGFKAFACENKVATCDYRMAQKGALSTVPFIGARMVHPAREDMMLLTEDQDTPPEITKMSDKIIEELKNTETGSVTFLFIHSIEFQDI